MIQKVHPAFDREGFVSRNLLGFNDLEIKDRARRISAALAETLPQDSTTAIEILLASLKGDRDGPLLSGMGAFLYLPYVFFVAEQGLDCFETSMLAQYELTKVFNGTQKTLEPGETATIKNTISVAQHSTRTHYPGTDRVEVMLNGVSYPGAEFELH